MSTKPTISQIADIPGVSIAIVSRFISNTATIKDSTTKKIMEAIRSLDYPLPEGFIATSTKKDGRAVLINVPSISNPFYNDVIKGAQDAALRHDYYTLVNVRHLNSSTESTFFSPLNNTNLCDAIILNAVDRGYFNSLYHAIPLIQYCGYMENRNLVSYTNIGNVTVAKTMMECILSAGYTKIAFLCGSGRYKYARQRKTGYLQILEAARIPLNKGWIIQLPELDLGIALSSAHQLMLQKEHPTAVFAVPDVLTAAVIRGCRLAGPSVSADTVVTGFGSMNISRATSPPTTTISQPKYQMGYMTCELLIEKLDTLETKPRQALLNTELTIRESTQRQRTQYQSITDRGAYFGVK